jgi:hypothetical protein
VAGGGSVMARRRFRVPKIVDKFAVAFIVAGLVWILLTSHLLRFPHTPALVIATLAGGLVLGMYVRAARPRLRIGPVRISIGAGRPRSRRRTRGGRR